MVKWVLLDDDSENKEEPEPKTSTTAMYDDALHVSKNLLLFLTQYSEEELGGTMFKVVTELQTEADNYIKTVDYFAVY